MKVLRATRFKPDLSTVTMVIRQPDAVMPLEEVGGEEFGFLISDIFEMDGEPDTELATYMANDRMLLRSHDEKNMAIMYYWTFAYFRLLKPGGVIVSDQPAPLTEAQIRYVWNQLAKLDEYKQFRLTTFDKDGAPVTYPKTGV